MVSVDTDIIVYSLNRNMPESGPARLVLEELAIRGDVALAEQVLVEVYPPIRKPAVFPHPFSASDATAVCQAYRANPRWRLIECTPVMNEVWRHADAPAFARRRIIDAHLALTLQAAGVTESATHDTADFAGFGFERVWDPLA